jgi:hypothetical protein
MKLEEALRQSVRRDARYKVDAYRPKIIHSVVQHLQNLNDSSKQFDADIHLWKLGILYVIEKLQLKVDDPRVRDWLGIDSNELVLSGTKLQRILGDEQ